MEDGAAFVRSETGKDGVGYFVTQLRLPELIARLAQYEDTGLEPEEITEQGQRMNWIKVTPETMPPDMEEVFVTAEDEDGDRYPMPNCRYKECGKKLLTE